MTVARSRVVVVGEKKKKSERTEVKLIDWTEREAEVILTANISSGG